LTQSSQQRAQPEYSVFKKGGGVVSNEMVPSGDGVWREVAENEKEFCREDDRKTEESVRAVHRRPKEIG
jgi:hypothetical protein